jgi:hypothetical protein
MLDNLSLSNLEWILIFIIIFALVIWANTLYNLRGLNNENTKKNI